MSETLKQKCGKYEKILVKYEEKWRLTVKVLSKKYNQWRIEREEEKASFKEIMEQEKKKRERCRLKNQLLRSLRRRKGW